jgi:hypothetical protein
MTSVTANPVAALQHANNSAQFLEAAGRVRFGMEPGMPLF